MLRQSGAAMYSVNNEPIFKRRQTGMRKTAFWKQKCILLIVNQLQTAKECNEKRYAEVDKEAVEYRQDYVTLA